MLFAHSQAQKSLL
ncbi:hypothetical protein D043_2689A, partial [Vibrio parahaemolyticus EKP-021]